MADDIGYEKRRQFGSEMLESIVDWIRDNVEPYCVFDKDQIIECANQYSIEDVFTTKELEEWAVANGFTKD